MIVGYCGSCEHFIPHPVEFPVNHGLYRFGACDIDRHPLTHNAMCDQYSPAARFSARLPAGASERGWSRVGGRDEDAHKSDSETR